MNTLSFASRFRTAAVLAAFSDREGVRQDAVHITLASRPTRRQAHLRLRAVARLAVAILRRKLRRNAIAFGRPPALAMDPWPGQPVRWTPQGISRSAMDAAPSAARGLASHFAFSEDEGPAGRE